MKNKFVPVAYGDIADMMLEGCLCQCCGVYIGDGDGYPVSCADCKDDE